MAVGLGRGFGLLWVLGKWEFDAACVSRNNVVHIIMFCFGNMAFKAANNLSC